MCATVRIKAARVLADAPRNGFDAQGSFSFADTHRPGSGRNREGRDKGSAWQVDDLGL
jgi:hypothetical protein